MTARAVHRRHAIIRTRFTPAGSGWDLSIDVGSPAMPFGLPLGSLAVQKKSSVKARTRGVGRIASALIFGSVGTIVIVHCAGTLDLLSSTDRT
jgi:hypothetical protein